MDGPKKPTHPLQDTPDSRPPLRGSGDPYPTPVTGRPDDVTVDAELLRKFVPRRQAVVEDPEEAKRSFSAASRSDVTLLDSATFPIVDTPGSSSTHEDSDPRAVGFGAHKTAPDHPEESMPDYILHESIGKGGHGEVWSALQSSLDREVAVKIIRQGRSESALGSFLQEAYTTAELDHPNIVPVYDLSQSRIGERDCHLLSMKLIHGTPWHELISQDRAKEDFNWDSFLSRHLAILTSVCNAVAYAHAKDILHLDLKPSQVVVGEFGEVYLMDWGLSMNLGRTRVSPVSSPEVAKFKTPDSVSTPSGTPAYMAPEQTYPHAAVLGPHTDIYLLGGILFEVLSGKAPHVAASASIAFQRAHRNEIEPFPAGAPEELITTARRALATQPTNRFSSVNVFREELDRYLSGAGRQSESRQIVEEVRARLAAQDPSYEQFVSMDHALVRALSLWRGNPEAPALREEVLTRHAERSLQLGDLQLTRSIAMHVRNEGRRREILSRVDKAEASIREVADQNRHFKVLAASFLIIALVAIAAFSEFRRRASERSAELDRASQRVFEQQRLVAIFDRTAKLRAEEAALARQFSSALPRPTRLLAEDDQTTLSLTAAEAEHLLDERNRVRELRRSIAPMADASIETAGVSRSRRAEEWDRRMDALAGPEPPELTLGEANLVFFHAESAADYLEAYRLYEEASRFRPSNHEPRVAMGIAATRAGYLTSATMHLEEAANLAKADRGPNSEEYADVLALQADALRLLDMKDEDFVHLYEKSLEVLEPRWSDMSINIAARWAAAGRFEKSVDISSATLTLHETIFGPDDPRTGEALMSYASAMGATGHYSEAEALVRRALVIAEKNAGQNSRSVAEILDNLATAIARQGRFADAEPLYRTAFEIRRSQPNPNEVEIARSDSNIALLLYEMGKYDEAEKLFVSVLATWESRLGADHPNVGLAYNNLGSFYMRLQRYEDSEKALLRALEIRERRLGPDHPVLTTTLNNMAILYSRQGRFDEAEKLYLRAQAIQEKQLGPKDPKVALRLNNLGTLYRRQGKLDLAEKTLRRAHAIWEEAHGASHPDTTAAVNNIAMVLYDQGKFEEAVGWYERSLAAWIGLLPPTHPNIMNGRTRLAATLLELGRAEEARAMLVQALRGAGTSLDPKKPDVAFTLRLLADASARLGDTDSARILYAQAATIIGSQLRGSHIEVTRSLEGLALLWADAPPSVDRDASIVGMGAFLESGSRERPTLSSHEGLPAVMMSEARLASEMLTLQSPRPDLARRLALRALAVAGVADVPTTSPIYLQYLNPNAESLGLADVDPATYAMPAELWPSLGEPIPTAAFYAWLDAVAAPVDWGTEFPGAENWSLASLDPAGEELAARALEIVAHLIAEIPPPVDPVLAAP
jgi:serine/threonine protein kinase/tetratricopeptide (TPR) repeat protein